MNTIALEFVPPNVEDGPEKAAEEAAKVRDLAAEFGFPGRIRHLMIPGMIEEDPDRPVQMKPKMDPLDVWKAVSAEVPDMRGLCTQVTPFLQPEALRERVRSLRVAGVDGVIFVGVPRTMADGDGDGMAPTDALHTFADEIPNRGGILIPTRKSEFGRFEFKCKQGATFGMTQLLHSDAIVAFLKDFAANSHYRPEIMLSFGFIPKAENRVKLMNWLIQDPGNPAVEAEQHFIARLAETPFKQKKRELVDLYKRVMDGVADLGFPLSLHLEAPYGFTKPAFETFSAMLETGAPDQL